MPQHQKHVIALLAQGIEAGSNDAEILGRCRACGSSQKSSVSLWACGLHVRRVVGKRDREVADERNTAPTFFRKRRSKLTLVDCFARQVAGIDPFAFPHNVVINGAESANVAGVEDDLSLTCIACWR